MENFERVVSNKIEEMDEAALGGLRQDLRHMIDHIANRIHYAEQRRSHLGLMGAGFVTAGVGLLPLWINKFNELYIKLPMIVFCLCLTVLGLTVIFIFSRQTNYKYPFTHHTKTWKWFYRDALKDSNEFTVKSTKYFSHSDDDINKERKIYNSQWDEFAKESVPKLFDVKQHVIQDFCQIYVLHINERYKNLFLTHLRKVISLGLFFSFFIVITSLALTIMFEGYIIDPINHSNSAGLLSVKSIKNKTTNHKIINGKKHVQVLSIMDIEIYDKLPEPFNKVMILNKNGGLIPAEIERVLPDLSEIKGPFKGKVVIFFYLQEDIYKNIDRITLE